MRACTPKCLPLLKQICAAKPSGTQACLRAGALRLPARSRSGEGRARKRGNLIEKDEIASFHSQRHFSKSEFGYSVHLYSRE